MKKKLVNYIKKEFDYMIEVNNRYFYVNQEASMIVEGDEKIDLQERRFDILKIVNREISLDRRFVEFPSPNEIKENIRNLVGRKLDKIGYGNGNISINARYLCKALEAFGAKGGYICSYRDPIIIFENDDPVPRCPACGKMVRPDVTLYGEILPDPAYENAIRMIREADCLIIGGTSLEVGSAAGLAHTYHGKYLVIINKGKTKMEGKADLVFHESIGKILGQL